MLGENPDHSPLLDTVVYCVDDAPGGAKLFEDCVGTMFQLSVDDDAAEFQDCVAKPGTDEGTVGRPSLKDGHVT